ncbi:MAG: diaminopimelate epimerase [Jiangellaceae bacterium]|nr:diaminopimelate epimerase [Jiangellaceae bacterium]
MLRRFPFVKGHGTENDFVLLPDHDGEAFPDLDPATVRRLTDRPSGLGADGVIRVVRSEALPEGRDQADRAEWFMDYRNADGSAAEMCGNGIRVLARYLWSAGLAPGPELPIGTRAGVRTVHEQADGSITVNMGGAVLVAIREPMTVTAGGRTWPINAVFAPNPHAVAFVDDLDDPGRLVDAPRVLASTVFPHGANVEFAVVRGPRHVAMRVWERGVGETRSCGTGVCAAAFALMERDGSRPGSSYIVDVPGGRLTVMSRDDSSLLLTGPAVLGVSGTAELPRV